MSREQDGAEGRGHGVVSVLLSCPEMGLQKGRPLPWTGIYKWYWNVSGIWVVTAEIPFISLPYFQCERLFSFEHKFHFPNV
jgi:hypothetical protein